MRRPSPAQRQSRVPEAFAYRQVSIREASPCMATRSAKNAHGCRAPACPWRTNRASAQQDGFEAQRFAYKAPGRTAGHNSFSTVRPASCPSTVPWIAVTSRPGWTPWSHLSASPLRLGDRQARSTGGASARTWLDKSTGPADLRVPPRQKGKNTWQDDTPAALAPITVSQTDRAPLSSPARCNTTQTISSSFPARTIRRNLDALPTVRGWRHENDVSLSHRMP